MTNSKHSYFLLFFVTLIALFLINPNNTNAWFTTNQEVVDLGNGSGLFLIEYVFGVEKYDLHIPVKASVTEEQENDKVSYEIMNRGGERAKGDSFGLVLSNTPINENGMYVVPKGEAKVFKLAVFFTPEEGLQDDKYRLHVRHLPFQFDGKEQLQLNPSELQYYKTRQLRL